MFAYCLNNPIRYADDSGHAVYDCFDESDDKNNPFDDIDSIGGGNRSLGVSSYYASGAAKYSNGGNGTGSMVGDMAYQQTKAANTTCVPQYSWGDLLNLLTGNSSSQCFVAGTLIQTADGTKPIEDIQVGDFVWAWNEETGDVSLKAVVETYINKSDELVHISVNGVEIVCTPSHPFYSPIKGWTDAVHLRAGDILALVNGEYVVVEKVQHEILEAPVAVYNFQVEDYHTYYVSDVGILVHNSCDYKPLRDGDMRAVINPGELEAPHAHVFQKSNNIGRIFSNGTMDASLLNNRDGMRFVKNHYDEIIALIGDFYGKR